MLIAAMAIPLLMSNPMAPAEVRGTWLTTTANRAIASPQETEATMRRLRDLGLNTVYVEVWKNGYTEFPSETMERAIGIPLRVNASPGGPTIQRDLLDETLIHAHRNGLIYVAWFEYGFMAAHQGTQNELRKRRDWIVLDREGNDVAKNGFVWMNPLHPDAQELLLGIVKDAIRKYDLDGIQLDDRIVWPYIDMGYDPFTRDLYRKETGREVPDDPREPQWVKWRTDKVEAFAKRFVREVREAAGPDFLISISPGPHPWALENYLIDWPAWSRWTGTPTWDEYIPQVYRMNYRGFEAEWNRQVGVMGDRKRDLIAGIRMVGDGPDMPREEVAAHAELVRKTGGGGHVWWFSRGVLDVFPNEVAALYDVARNGQAPHPRFGATRRPAPIVGRRAGGDRWEFRAPAGRYRLIARIQGTWKTVRSVEVGASGRLTQTVANAESVELLRQIRK